MTSSVRSLRQEAVAALANAGVTDPEVDAELLIGHVLGASRGEVHAKIAMGSEVTDEQEQAVRGLVSRRATREPLQHITGRAPFRNLELLVGPGVFVPRPETELLAGIAIDALGASATAQPIAVDLGTGSGAIALAMATEVPHARVYAVELSPDAHEWARRNIEHTGAAVTLVLGDLTTALAELDGTVSVVASNPPYVPTDAVPRDPEVRLYDPELALYGGDDGLDVVRKLSVSAQRLLHSGGTLAIEHGELQGADIRRLLIDDGWHASATHRDLLGRDRITTAIR